MKLSSSCPLAETWMPQLWQGIEIGHNCQTHAKYDIRHIANTITNTKYQTTNKCQTWSVTCWIPPEIHQGHEQSIIEGNLTIPEQFENQNKIPVQLSSNCQYRNADKNVNAWNSRATIVSHPQLRMTREREPSRISYKMVTRLSNGKKKMLVKLFIRN